MKTAEYIKTSIEFGKRLALLMQDKNISLEKLSKETGLDKHTLSNWIYGKTLPRVKNVVILAKYFKVKTDFLIGLTSTK